MKLDKYVNSKKYRTIYKILDCWTSVVVDKYLSHFEDEDNFWWYNERATISSLAAAAWLSNAIALEEYATRKGKPEEEANGRCDLYIGLKDEGFAIEAKQAWCPIGKGAKNGLKNASDGLLLAIKDARKLASDEGNRFGVCFMVPYLPKNQEPNIDKLLEGWLKNIESLDNSFIAWAFPEKARGHISPNGRIYPGVVLLAKKIGRQV